MAKITVKHYWDTATQNIGSVGASFQPLTLQQIQADQVLAEVVKQSKFATYLCNGNQVINADQAKITFGKLQGAKFHELSLDNKLDPFTLSETVSVKWDNAIVARQGLTGQEAREGAGDYMGAKADKMIAQFANLAERKAIERLEEKIIQDQKQTSFNYLSSSADAIRTKILDKVRDLTETVDPKQGLDGIDESNIIILAKPRVMDKLAQVVGNNAQNALDNGASGIATIGGFPIVPHPYLKKFDIVITTKFVGVKADELLSVYAGPVGLGTSNVQVSVEGKTLSGIIWDNLAYGLASSTQTANSKNEFIEVEAEGVKHAPTA